MAVQGVQVLGQRGAGLDDLAAVGGVQVLVVLVGAGAVVGGRGEGWGGDTAGHAGVFHDGDGVAHLAVGEVVAGAVSVPVLFPSGPVALLQLGLLIGGQGVDGVMQALLGGLPFLPGLLLAVGDVVGQLGPFEVEGQPLTPLLLWLRSDRAGA